jgi:cell filamentation protein, protein adenylyltransferase
MKNVHICTKIKQPEGYIASMPNPFPKKELFNIPQNLIIKAAEAERLLGKLDGITQILPNMDFFLRMFSYKDATSSSRIEGTQATMADALEHSVGIETNQNDASDIIFYIKSLNYGMERIKDFPISLRFIRELHKKLMQGARTTHFSDPGEFRTSQNWIGGTNLNNAKFIPVPPKEMISSLADLETFIYDSSSTLPIINIGYAHAQFETIHPFLDGNGRTGRMLITFLLVKRSLLEKPVLFLSSFFNRHKSIYYERLLGYQNEGKVFDWIEFFLDGVIETAKESIEVSKKIREIRDEDMEKIQGLAKRESDSGVKVLSYLFENPIVTTKNIMQATSFTRAGAQRLINRFIDLNILIEQPKKINYDKKYIYNRYFNAFID